MKIENYPTEYLLIKAQTNSNWDSCDFVIVQVSADWHRRLLSRLQTLETFAKDNSFFSLAYWEEPMGYYIHRPQEADELRDFLDSDEAFNSLFVSLDLSELNNLMVPENKLGAH